MKIMTMVETQYKSSVRGWMSDAGGEFKSKVFTKLLTEKGIKVLQSIPHVHQQNGQAERIMRTLMDKAESMRLEACLPQSWWEFALDHATHVYNRTPIHRLGWMTPSEFLSGSRPSVDHLRVFGCAAYVFIPAEVRVNKLAPKSKLMTYLGSHPGGRGWIFMRRPNNVIFSAAQAIFDESVFPNCPKSIVRVPNTRLHTPVPKPKTCTGDNCKCPLPLEAELDSFPEHTSSSKGKGVALKRTWRTGEDVPIGPPVVPVPPVPEQQRPPTPPGPCRSGRAPKPLIKPDNIYGDKTPVEIEKDISKPKDWRCIVGKQSSLPQHGNIPGSSRQPPPEPLSEGEGLESEEEVQGSLEPSNDDEESVTINRLCWEGGVAFQHFLISRAIPSINVAHEDYEPEIPRQSSSPKEWTYRDILRLPASALEEWRTACERELEALHKRKVYDLVPRPQGRKVIKNRWVFNVKDDGRKRACLVAKGFSQVEGLDYDQVFSPVVRFETVRLILAMAALEGWVAYGLDVCNAYLYGELDEEIYMEQPEGFRAPDKEDFVLRLRRVLYRLKQAGLAWW